MILFKVELYSAQIRLYLISFFQLPSSARNLSHFSLPFLFYLEYYISEKSQNF